MSDVRKRGNTRQAASRTSRSSQSSADRILAVQNARNRSAGTTRRNPRTTASRSRNRRRRQGPHFAKILLIAIGIVIFLICVAVGVNSCARNGEEKESQAETTEPETELSAEVTVNGVSINGLTQTEAREKVLSSIGWGMKVSYNGETMDVDDVLETKVDAVLAEAFSAKESKDYTFDATGLEEEIKAQAEKIAAAWDKAPKNGSISSYDKATNEFLFADGENGIKIDQEKLVTDITAALAAGDYTAVIEASASTVAPEITKEQAKASFKRIGTFTTTTTSNKDRNENIRLASEALNGLIIQPGEEFSMNAATGERTPAKGYKPAGAYLNGVLIEEPGGGVCQVSSTLYNAVVFSGLKTTERHAHSYEPSYVTPGEDAMISYGSADMKFLNNSTTAVGIKTSFSNNKLTISIYGSPILEDGVTVSMKSEKTQVIDPPAPTYEEDPTLEPGVEKVVKEATPGSRWVTNLVKTKDGVVIEDSFLHNSTYNGKPATIRRNTSGSVLTTEGESISESESSTAESSSAGSPLTTPASPENPQPTASEPGISGPGYEESPGNGQVRPSEEPGSNILPSESGGPASQPGGQQPGSEPGNSPDVVTIPQTTPAPVTTTGPGNGLISPIG